MPSKYCTYHPASFLEESEVKVKGLPWIFQNKNKRYKKQVN